MVISSTPENYFVFRILFLLAESISGETQHCQLPSRAPRKSSAMQQAVAPE
jgi:hypothetical protein